MNKNARAGLAKLARRLPGQNGKPNISLVPQKSLTGFALAALIAIMTFLSALSMGAALQINDASRNWLTEVSDEMTIQVRPQAGRKLDEDVEQAAKLARESAGIVDVQVLDRSKAAKMLEPWLGAGTDFSDLPIPRLIVLKTNSSAKVGIATLRSALRTHVPNATLDDHQSWSSRLSTMARTMEGVGLIFVMLILSAMMLSIFFAVRASIAGTQHVIDVLHFVGAEDRFIAAEFDRHFRNLGIKGGLLGGLLALAVLVTGQAILGRWTSGAGADQIEALFGSFSIRWIDFMIIIVLSVFIGFLSGLISRITVMKHLKTLY